MTAYGLSLTTQLTETADVTDKSFLIGSLSKERVQKVKEQPMIAIKIIFFIFFNFLGSKNG